MNARRSIAVILAAALAGAAALCSAPAADAQLLMKELPEDAQGVDVHDRRGAQLPLDLEFTDPRGRTVRLADYFDGERPVVLIFGYYDCPLLCDLIFTRAQRVFNELAWTLGREYRALTISFDHTNTVSDAAAKKAGVLAGYTKKPVPDDAWEFLVASAPAARAVTDAAGYAYKYLPQSGEYAHPAALVVVSPEGVVSTYLYGLQYPERQLRLALLEASQGRVGTLFDSFLHRCFVYDPDANSFVPNALFLMNLGGIATVILLAATIGGLLVFERRKRRTRGARERTQHQSPPAARPAISA